MEQEIVKTAMRRSGIRSMRELARAMGYRGSQETRVCYALRRPQNIRLWQWRQMDKVLRFTDAEWQQLKEG
jgi:hypothetical protein